jgi:hypothetical protein
MSGLSIGTVKLSRALTAEKARRRRAAFEGARALAASLEAWARANRPWHDRTGRARRALEAKAEASGERVRISLTASVPYAAALERGRGGRYALLGPAVRRFAPELTCLARGDGA